MFKRFRTPHKNPLQHLLNMYVYFLVGAMIVTVGRLGVHATWWLGAVGAMAISPMVALVFGILVTMVIRRAFGLVQTGRLVQYAGFWLSSFAGLWLAAQFPALTLTITQPVLASLAFFAVSFGMATLFLQVPWRGRTWLPMRKKDKATTEETKN